MTLNFSNTFENRMPMPASGEVSESLMCQKCKKLLYNAMLITECGCKYCERPCFEDVQSEGSCPGGTDECGPPAGIADKGTRRNVLNLKVKCIYDCDFQGKFRELEAHLQLCPNSPVLCRFCSESQKRSEIDHHLKVCESRRILCEFCTREILHSEMNEHHDILSPNSCSSYVGSCPYCKTPGFTRQDLNSHKSRCDKWPVECPFQAHGCDFTGTDLKKHMTDCVPLHQEMLLQLIVTKQEGLKKRNEQLEEENEALKKTCEELKTKSMQIQEEFEERWKKLRKVQTILANCREKQIDTDKLLQRHGDIDTLLSHVQSANSSRSQSDVMGSDPQAYNMYNGVFMWKIDGYRSKRTQAMNGTTLAITSVPFFSEPYGYKMCCRVYLNGDGSGKGTHMSVFIVLMKSKYDSILKWPFVNRVTFTLINQERGENRVETFSPDQMSQSFKKPQDDMNIASGCPRFISFQQIDGSNFRSPFLQDDTIFLRIQVSR